MCERRCSRSSISVHGAPPYYTTDEGCAYRDMQLSETSEHMGTPKCSQDSRNEITPPQKKGQHLYKGQYYPSLAVVQGFMWFITRTSSAFS